MRLGNRERITFTKVALGILLVCWTSVSFASSHDDLQIQIFKYTSDHDPVLSISNQSEFTSENFLLRTDLYIEGGPKGSWSFDPDPLRYNLKLNESGSSFLWFGREHPLNLVREQPVEVRSALGSVWTQNQLDALDPRVSGWIGTGLVQTLDSANEWKLTAAYSPLFLPTFGPSLGFTERGDLNPSRFARLPPAQVTTNGVTVPIRYQLRIDQLSELLLQHQAFLGVSHSNRTVNMDAYVYTAPRPDPVARTNAKLAVGEDAVNARVDVNPQFPREYWGGVRVQNKTLSFQPAIELLQKMNELSVHIASITGYFDTPQVNPFVIKHKIKSSFGIVSHMQRMFEGPTQSDFLVFLRMPFNLSEMLVWRTAIETTLLNAKTGLYWMNELEYKITQTFSASAAIRVLSGEDNSYYGDWRNQDSYSAGMKWSW